MVEKTKDIGMRPVGYEHAGDDDMRERNKALGTCRKLYKASKTCSTISKWGLSISIVVYLVGLGLSIATDRIYNRDYKNYKPYCSK